MAIPLYRSNRDVLVTGGAGFIGSTLARALLDRGDDVRILDNFSTGRRGNLAGIERDVEVLETDLRDRAGVMRAVRGSELVFHQGALPSVPRSVRDPLTTSAVNIEGTLNVLTAAQHAGVRRVVFASSSSIYGDAGPALRTETMAARPLSPYAVSKLAAEQYCVSFKRVYGLETVCLRYFNVFGPAQDPVSEYAAVVPRFVTAIAAGEPVRIYGDGTQSRDFTYVGNVVDANLRAADAAGAGGAVVNVAAGCATSVDRLADEIGAVLGLPVEKEYLPPRPGDVLHSLADLSLARGLLGYEPAIELAEGLLLTVADLEPGVRAAEPLARTGTFA